MKEAFKPFIESTIEELESDSRFLGLAIGGSWTRNEIDEFSDLDLLIICDTGQVPDPISMRSLAVRLGPLVSSFTGEHVGEPSLMICLYKLAELVHVDLKFSAVEELECRPYDPVVVWERGSIVSDVIARTPPSPPSPNQQWIEDRFWTWVHYAALRLGRGEVFELVGFLSFIREQVLGPLALHSAGFPPYGVRKIERYLPEFARRLEQTVPTYDLESCYAATLATIETYRELRNTAKPAVEPNSQAETESVRFLKGVATRLT